MPRSEYKAGLWKKRGRAPDSGAEGHAEGRGLPRHGRGGDGDLDVDDVPDARAHGGREAGPEKHKGEVFQVAGNQWRLTLGEKQRILTTHIFGVDIDVRAVEVTRFGLLLKILENESAEALDGFLKNSGRKALPDLKANVQCGNSLVDPQSFTAFEPHGLDTAESFEVINPLDWQTAFGPGTDGGLFDVVVGNPPYIRIQNMVKYSPKEVEFYEDASSPYACAKSNNFDKYALFIERALSLLKRNGFLGYIVPHKFFVIKSGMSLRELLVDDHHVAEMVHFGVQQVFAERTTTYTCILIASKSGVDNLKVEYVKNLEKWRKGQQGEATSYKATELGKEPWEFLPPGVKKIFDALRTNHPRTLDTVSDVFVGVQTSKDKVYVVKPTYEDANWVVFKAEDGKRYKIEKTILRPCLMDVEFKPFGTPKPNSYIIFPYDVSSGRARLYTPEEMKQKCPLTLAYLSTFRRELDERDVMNRTPMNWYQYGRSQSLTKFDGRPKLVWPILQLEPKYNYDDKNTVITGGGNGPYYALRPLDDSTPSIFFLQALLSHPAIDTMVVSRASRFRAGYVSHGKQFIEHIPVPTLDVKTPEHQRLMKEIDDVVQSLDRYNDELRDAQTPEKLDSLTKLCDQLKNKMITLVNEAYGLASEDIDQIAEYRSNLFLGEE